MRAGQQCKILFYKKLFQPLERRDIEVVRRLVEQQQIGIVEQQAGETEPGALATREGSDLPVAKDVQT